MAGFEKFEPTEEWRNKLKNFLLMDRKTVVKKPVEPVSDTKRYSMEISWDFKKILKERNIPRSNDEAPKNHKNDDHIEKENQPTNDSFNWENIKIKKQSPSFVDETLNESFEAMENICEKTASDPNSTLFKYINSKNKKEIIEEKKKRLSANENVEVKNEHDADNAKIDRILDRLRDAKLKEINDESHCRSTECTQIEDIEAPSRFWDNTVLQTSPVKMVGLLRPSTIIEEAADADVSDTSSGQTSFKSAVRTLAEEGYTSSSYETASEQQSIHSKIEIDPLKIQDSQADPLLINEEDYHLINVPQESIDAEKTIAPNNSIEELIELQSSSESEDSVIEILSDDDEENLLSPFRHVQNTPKAGGDDPLIKWETPFQVKKENLSSSLSQSEAEPAPPKEEANSSLHFNDTLEEVEYMMKKGLEMIQADNVANESHEISMQAKNHVTLTPNVLQERQNTFTVTSPFKGANDKRSPAQFRRQGALPKVPSAKKAPTSAADRFALNIKPVPKFELFKKPIPASKPVPSSGARHKDPFAYIRSPIATYVNKTPTAPFMTTTKVINKDDHNSTAFRELEKESKLYKPQYHHDKLGNYKFPKTPNARTLPKKAYISSEFRQVKDERSPVTIPGGQKIQKYLNAAVTPAVIRHDGKAKLTGCTPKLPYNLQKTKNESNSNTPKRPDGKDKSLADLSLMSGDVSLYTIKDAKKL